MVPTCVTVTSLGLPVAPGAVTRIVPCRVDVLMFWVNAAVIVPLSVPLEPDWIDNQLLPEMTEAVQLMVPVPVLETEKVVRPE